MRQWLPHAWCSEPGVGERDAPMAHTPSSGASCRAQGALCPLSHCSWPRGLNGSPGLETNLPTEADRGLG